MSKINHEKRNRSESDRKSALELKLSRRGKRRAGSGCHPDRLKVRLALLDYRGVNPFLLSLKGQIMTRFRLTDKQITAALRALSEGMSKGAAVVSKC